MFYIKSEILSPLNTNTPLSLPSTPDRHLWILGLCEFDSSWDLIWVESSSICPFVTNFFFLLTVVKRACWILTLIWACSPLGDSTLSWCFLFFFSLVLPVYCYQPISLHPCAHMLSHVIPWTSACQIHLSMDFSRQEYWNGLPFPSPELVFFESRNVQCPFCILIRGPLW